MEAYDVIIEDGIVTVHNRNGTTLAEGRSFKVTKGAELEMVNDNTFAVRGENLKVKRGPTLEILEHGPSGTDLGF